MDAQRFEPMSVGQILDGAFKLYQKNFVRFIAIVAVAYVPIGLINFVGYSVMGFSTPKTLFTVDSGSESSGHTGLKFKTEMGKPIDPDRVSPGRTAIGFLFVAAGGILSIFAYYLCGGALMKSVSEAYLGKEATVGEAYRFVWPKLGWLIAGFSLVGLTVLLGLVLFIVPGIIFSLWYALTGQVIVLENCRATKGMSRSKALTSGNLGKVFVVGLVAGLIVLVISGVVNGAVGMMGFAVARSSTTASLFLTQLGSVAGEVLALPISSAAMILLYYDLRIRKEGFDLEMLAKSLNPSKDDVG